MTTNASGMCVRSLLSNAFTRAMHSSSLLAFPRPHFPPPSPPFSFPIFPPVVPPFARPVSRMALHLADVRQLSDVGARERQTLFQLYKRDALRYRQIVPLFDSMQHEYDSNLRWAEPDPSRLIEVGFCVVFDCC